MAATRRRRGVDVPPATVKAVRARAGWTQDEAADVARVKLRQWQRWESGEAPINAASWVLVCQAAKVAEDWEPSAGETTQDSIEPSEPKP